MALNAKLLEQQLIAARNSAASRWKAENYPCNPIPAYIQYYYIDPIKNHIESNATITYTYVGVTTTPPITDPVGTIPAQGTIRLLGMLAYPTVKAHIQSVAVRKIQLGEDVINQWVGSILIDCSNALITLETTPHFGTHPDKVIYTGTNISPTVPVIYKDIDMYKNNASDLLIGRIATSIVNSVTNPALGFRGSAIATTTTSPGTGVSTFVTIL